MSLCISNHPFVDSVDSVASFESIVDWSNLLLAWKKASKGKRRAKACAQFEYKFADHLLELQSELITASYLPGQYTNFHIHEPKRRLISAAPFRDRVVHHALCNVIEPVFEAQFIPDSYANRVNKGTHRAVDRFQTFCQRYPYVLRLVLQQHRFDGYRAIQGVQDKAWVEGNGNSLDETHNAVLSALGCSLRASYEAVIRVVAPFVKGTTIPCKTRLAANHFITRCTHQTYIVGVLDIVKHFQSMDHGVLLNTLSQYLQDKKTLELIRIIIDSGQGLGSHEEQASLTSRPIGLPIGNLTSQFWSNCYMHPLDTFIKRELGCHGYLRYVDDFAMFSHSKKQLWEWKSAIKDKLNTMRLRFHDHNAQVAPVSSGIPWLGFVIYPEYRRLKRRKVVHATRRLNQRFDQWQTGQISFAEFDASVQGWINHVRYADSWGLRKHMLGNFSRTKEGK